MLEQLADEIIEAISEKRGIDPNGIETDADGDILIYYDPFDIGTMRFIMRYLMNLRQRFDFGHMITEDTIVLSN